MMAPLVPSSPPAEAGFSLTEVLVSVFIFAVIGTISVSLMSASLAAQEQNGDVLADATRLDTARTLMREDVGQLVRRPVRDAEGRSLRAVFAGDADGLDGARDGERVILSFTRRGRANPGHLQPRSSLARVDWLLREGDLVRRVWRYPDGAAVDEAIERVLVGDIAEVELDFLVGAAWSRRISVVAGQGEQAFPRAVRLRYQDARLGAMEHILLTPEAGG